MASALSNELTFSVLGDRICIEQILVAHNLEEVATADVPRSHVECPACEPSLSLKIYPAFPEWDLPKCVKRRKHPYLPMSVHLMALIISKSFHTSTHVMVDFPGHRFHGFTHHLQDNY